LPLRRRHARHFFEELPDLLPGCDQAPGTKRKFQTSPGKFLAAVFQIRKPIRAV
jgi:hypothetical protein